MPPAGRVVDHVRFEVETSRSSARGSQPGVTFTRAYNRKTAEMNGIATAMLVDPWGVSIELTEGLDAIK